MIRPRCAAVAGGSGSSTIAAALNAQDLGVYRGGPVELMVVRDSVVALGAAHRAVNAAPGRPVLVVVATTPARMPRAAAARAEMVRPHCAGIVRVPFVVQWRETADPWSEAAQALRRPLAELPRTLRPFAESMHRLRDLLVELGRAGAPAAQPYPGSSPVSPPWPS